MTLLLPSLKEKPHHPTSQHSRYVAESFFMLASMIKKNKKAYLLFLCSGVAILSGFKMNPLT